MKEEEYKCPSYYDDNNILQDCICGRCGKDRMISEVYFGYLLSLIREAKDIKEAESKAIEWWNDENEDVKK